MSWLIPAAQAAESAPAPQGNPMSTLLLFGGMFLIFWFLIIRPQRKRQKEHQALVSALGKGDEVVMTSGMLGSIKKVDDTYVVIEVADGVEMTFQKAAVHAVLPKGTIQKI
ncbi:preprotein translocase subunit YajC [Porticoccus sp. W117]|uniref:preprotein translocase subunit YajC n=1 Tax=Porticoccus sp. W117 TaxID=3054777 RepID=UPI0025975B18|nr:preprotein translocase subunit YajC [Porticoccus sp. W117]MDM3871966.1 preprotein translocase subunit YajC [Porticoccus sp. W117]